MSSVEVSVLSEITAVYMQHNAKDSSGRQNNFFSLKTLFLIHMGNAASVMLSNHYSKRASIKNPELKLSLLETDLWLMTVIAHTKGASWCSIQAQRDIAIR